MMLHQYQLKHRPEHYGILVDLLGRTGELDKAMEIVKRMPNPAEPHVWGALLGACRIHNNVKLGEIVAKRLFELEPDDAASGVFKSLSDSPPTHCSLNIESFSLLSEFLDGNSSDPEDAYESEEFKAGGYKWKLVIYPRGNKKKKVEDHISVYLQIAGANSLEMGWEVYVDFRLFLLDQNKNIYMVFEDAFTRRNCIHGAKLDVGFDKLVPLDEFHDASHGYLVDDKCVFGAEVFVCKETRRGMGECISRVKSPKTYKHIWKLRNFSSLTDPYYTSEPFTIEDQKWIIQLYPKGVDQQNRHIGIYLQLVDRKATPPATKVFAELSIRIVHPLCSDLCWSRTDPVKRCYTIGGLGYGWNFTTLDYASRILCFDTCVVETKLTIHGITERASDSEEQNCSIKTKRASVDPNKIQPETVFHDASHEYLVGFGNDGDGDGDGGWECSEFGNLQQALCLHAHAIQTGFMDNIFVGASLIESYSKCGYGIHGQGGEALKVFDDMVKHSAVTPNDVTFTSVLSACTLEEGSMESKEHAVRILLFICQSCRESYRGLILREGVMPGLLQLTVDGTWKAKTMAEQLLLLLRGCSSYGPRNQQSRNEVIEQIMQEIDAEGEEVAGSTALRLLAKLKQQQPM
ncbi:hypothetical protein ACLB2K_053934 [Fragaria x ananassa]